jgi:hypothetical protein
MRTIICFVLCAMPFVITCRSQEVMTNETIVKMVKAGLTEELIIQAVQQQPGKYSVGADHLISLKAAGVSDKVISAMLTKSKSSSPAQEAAEPMPGARAAGVSAHRTIQIVQFDQRPGTGMQPESLTALTAEVVSALADSGEFDHVFTGQQTLAEGQPGLRLTGTVVEFKKGSRATRYLLGPASLAGPGKSVVKAHVKLFDNATGRILHEQDVDGRVWMGLFGGSSDGAKQGLAKEVAKIVSKKAF